MLARSKSHLDAAGEGYFEHLRFAATVGLLAIATGVACLIHAVVPALCTGTASRTIRGLTGLFDERHRIDEVSSDSAQAAAFVLLLGIAAIVVLPLWLADVPAVLRVVYTSLAFAIPLTLLMTDRGLEAEASAI